MNQIHIPRSSLLIYFSHHHGLSDLSLPFLGLFLFFLLFLLVLLHPQFLRFLGLGNTSGDDWEPRMELFKN